MNEAVERYDALSLRRSLRPLPIRNSPHGVNFAGAT